MSKKIIGALLALALVLSVFSFSVFAASTGYDNDPDHIQTWRLSAIEAGSGGTYTVKVYLTTNYEVGPIQFKIDGVDEVTDVQLGADYYENAQVSPSKSGFVIITPNTSAPVTVKKLTDAHVATVTYTSEENATPTMDENDYKSASNPNGKLAAIYAEGSQYLNACNLLTGQKAKVIPVGGDAPTPPATEADLQVKSGVTGVYVDKNKTFGGAYAGAVYGVTATTYKSAANITNNVEATNGGSLNIKPADNKTGCYGTGATIEVLNADGSTTGKTYVFVVFGDVDCNGLINGNDAQAVLDVVAGDASIAPNNSVKRLAGNCQNVSTSATMMHNLNGNDAQAIIDHVAGTKLSQTVLAETHNKHNNFYK